MQLQNGIEKPVIFVSHILSDQATRWGIMLSDLYAFVYRVKQLSPYLLGKQFTVRTDHKNLVYLSDSSIPKLVRWPFILSEYRFVIDHISGDQNIVTDGLTRVNTLQYNDVDKLKHHLYQNDSISRIFRLGGEAIEETEFLAVANEEGESGGEEDLDEYGIFEVQVSTITSYVFSISTYLPICRYARSAESR